MRHGPSSVLNAVDGKQRKALLRQESALRSKGEWGNWEFLPREQLGSMLLGLRGWVLEVTAAHRNRVFCVLERPDKSGAIHAAVVSLSQIRPTWYEMQRIKDELFGPDKTAVEVYPPKDEIVDGSDTYHIWILPAALPFSLRGLDRSRCGEFPTGLEAQPKPDQDEERRKAAGGEG